MEKATDKQIAYAKKLGIEGAESFSKQALREMIDRKKNEPKSESKSEYTKTYTPRDPDKKTTMYVSYAKDLFICLNGVLGKDISAEELMDKCIELVKQAKEAFE